MKYALFTLLSMIALGTTCPALTPEELLGEWELTSQFPAAEGVTGTATETAIFYKNGSHYSEGLGIIKLKEDNIRVLTFGGPEAATWTIKGKELHIQTTKTTLEFFSSALEEMDREAANKLLAESLEEPTIYTFVSRGKGKLIFKEKENGATVTFTRRAKPDQKTPQWAMPLNAYPANLLGNAPEFGKKDKKNDPTGERFRRTTKRLLDHDGFQFSKWLPTYGQRFNATKMRPTKEIAERILCNYICWAYVYQTEEQLPSKAITNYLEIHKLNGKLTEKEQKILKSDRKTAEENFGSAIGWKLENTWALAWVLGFEESIDIDQEPFGEATAPALLKFMNKIAKNPQAFLKTCNPRPLAEVAQMEDIFYCTHNAVRSAQTGRANCIPENFHPVQHGGIIHEKRHALTWVLSPKIIWDKTDLDT